MHLMIGIPLGSSRVVDSVQVVDPAVINQITLSNTTPSGTSFQVQATGALASDTVHWVAVLAAEANPSDTQIRSGQKASGTAADVAGNYLFSASGTASAPSGLDGTYKICAVIDNGALSNVVASTSFDLDSTAPLLTLPTAAESGGNIDWGVTSNTAGGTITAQLIDTSDDSVAATSTDTTPTADASNGGTFASPAAGTYRVDISQVDAAGNTSGVVSSADVTISAAGSIAFAGTGRLQSPTNIVNVDLSSAAEGDTLYVVMGGVSAQTVSLTLEGETQNAVAQAEGTGKFFLWQVPVNAAAAGNAAAELYQTRTTSGHRPYFAAFVVPGGPKSVSVIESGNADPNVISTTVSDGFAIAGGFDFQGVDPQFSGDIGSNVGSPIIDGNTTLNFAGANTVAGSFNSTWTGDPASLVEQSLFLLT